MEQRRGVERRVHETFRFELINRFDRVVHFKPLGRREIRSIAQRELTDLSMRDGLSSRGVTLEIDQDVLDWIVSRGYHPHYGARFLRREIERSVVGTLAEFVVREMPRQGDRLGLGVRRGRVHARLVQPAVWEEVTHPGRQVDRRSLLEEAETWLQRFERLATDSQVRRAEASKLIEVSSSRGFWDDRARAEDVLRRYKILDARLQVEERLLRPVDKLRAAVKRDEDSVVEDLGALVAAVSVSYRRWMELGAPDAPNGVWLMIGPADTVNANSEWLVDMVGMYRGWLRRKGYSYDVVAEEVVNGEVTRLVLEVEGAGALALLEMEEGEHRRRNPRQGVERARVWLVPRSEGRQYGAIPGGEVTDAKRGRGVAVPRRAARLTLQVPRSGLQLVLHGASTETLSLLGRDIGGLLSMAPSPAEVAREYAIQGGAVRDPRTSSSMATLKEVLRGNLEVFLRAWEAR